MTPLARRPTSQQCLEQFGHSALGRHQQPELSFPRQAVSTLFTHAAASLLSCRIRNPRPYTPKVTT